MRDKIEEMMFPKGKYKKKKKAPQTKHSARKRRHMLFMYEIKS